MATVVNNNDGTLTVTLSVMESKAIEWMETAGQLDRLQDHLNAIFRQFLHDQMKVRIEAVQPNQRQQIVAILDTVLFP